VQTSCVVAARALTGTMQRSGIAKPMVRRWILRTKRDWMMEWGSRIPSSLNDLRRGSRFREYNTPLADMPIIANWNFLRKPNGARPKLHNHVLTRYPPLHIAHECVGVNLIAGKLGMAAAYS